MSAKGKFGSYIQYLETKAKKLGVFIFGGIYLNSNVSNIVGWLFTVRRKAADCCGITASCIKLHYGLCWANIVSAGYKAGLLKAIWLHNRLLTVRTWLLT